MGEENQCTHRSRRQILAGGALASLVLYGGTTATAGEVRVSEQPPIETTDDTTVYIGSNDGTLYAVDAVTGDEQWRFTGPGNRVDSSPTVVDGTVYVGSSGTTEVPSNLYAVDAATGEEEWRFTEPDADIQSSPTVVDGIVYVGSYDYTMYAVDTATGEEEWRFTEPDDGIYSSPAVVDETVYFGSLDQTVYAVDAVTGEQVWAFTDVDDIVSSSPTVMDGIVYVGSWDETLYAIETDTGEQVWSFTEPTDTIRSSPTVVADPENGDGIGSRARHNTLGHHHRWAGVQPPDEGAGDELPKDDGLPGFGVGGAIAGLAGAGYLLRESLDQDDTAE